MKSGKAVKRRRKRKRIDNSSNDSDSDYRSDPRSDASGTPERDSSPVRGKISTHAHCSLFISSLVFQTQSRPLNVLVNLWRTFLYRSRQDIEKLHWLHVVWLMDQQRDVLSFLVRVCDSTIEIH